MAHPIVKGLQITVTKAVNEREYQGLRDFQRDVGLRGQDCMIEPVGLNDGSTMYVDEEFVFHGGEFNSIATDVAGLNGRGDLLITGIRGDDVIVGPVDGEGWDTDITDDQRKIVERVRREAVE